MQERSPEMETEMSKYDLIAILTAIRESAKEHKELKTVELIDKIMEEIKNK